MRYWFRCGLIVLACAVLLAGVARTENADASVSDGPSRGELFEARLLAELGPAGALSAAAAPSFFLPSDAKSDAIFGIDVSHHNDEACKCKPGQNCGDCKIDWSRIQSQKVSFVYVKASQGTKYRDPTFDYHWRTLAQNKISRGAYHFMSADEDPVVQAENFLEKLEQDGKLLSVDLPPCLDLESDLRKDNSKRWFVTDTGQIRDFWNGQEPDEILKKVLKWLKHVEEKTGRIPIIYTSRGWWNDRIKDEKKFAQLSRYPIWVANYPDSGSPVKAQPRVPNGQAWALWQFTETGRIKDSDVMPGKLDINIFNGTLGSFEQALGVTVPEKKEVASLEAPKDTRKPSEPVTDANPNQPTDTTAPAQQKEGSNPAQPTDSANPTQQANNANPTQPTDTTTSTQQTEGSNLAQPTDSAKPPQQANNANPTQPTDTTTPAQQTEGTNPGQPTDAAKPTQQATNANPTQPTDTTTPTQQATGTNPTQPTDATNPVEPKEAPKPPEQVASITPNEPKDTGAPANQQASVTPSDAKQISGTGSPQGRPSRNAASRAVQNAVIPNTISQSTPAQQSMVEIVLVNGRTIRVDANIDPVLLARLISALDDK